MFVCPHKAPWPLIIIAFIVDICVETCAGQLRRSHLLIEMWVTTITYGALMLVVSLCTVCTFRKVHPPYTIFGYRTCQDPELKKISTHL